MSNAQLAIIPRDGFFCKDGRGWFTSESGRGHGLEWPWPSTVRGALRTAWGRAAEDKAGCFDAGQWLTRTAAVRLVRMLALRRPHGAAWKPEHAVWPTPLDAILFEGKPAIERLDPRKPALPTLGRDDDEAREALWTPVPGSAEKPVKLPLWWGHAEMAAWLACKEVNAPGKDALRLERRLQVHVGIQSEELTAEESALYSHDILETVEFGAEWAIGVEAALPDGVLPATATLGSDARPARIESLPEAVFAPPTDVLQAFQQGSRGLRLVLVTPACFSGGWLPDILTSQGKEYRGELLGTGTVILRAAFVPRPMHISGWDMAAKGGRGAPKATARMAPPGAVYFFERADGKDFTEAEAKALWLAALGGRTEEGFGLVVPGVWIPARSNT